MQTTGAKFKFGRILGLSVHRDDECLSYGGVLTQHEGPLHIHYFNSVHPLVEQEVYNAEARAVREALGCTVSYSQNQLVNGLHLFPISVFISEIEFLINDFQPDTIIIPAKSMNQDHRVVHDAAITATRTHDKNWFVRQVLLAEQPETHTPAFPSHEFSPQLFIPIDIDKKLALYHLYTSQQRAHRSDDHIRAIATFRGMQAGVSFAEAFQVIRIVA